MGLPAPGGHRQPPGVSCSAAARRTSTQRPGTHQLGTVPPCSGQRGRTFQCPCLWPAWPQSPGRGGPEAPPALPAATALSSLPAAAAAATSPRALSTVTRPCQVTQLVSPGRGPGSWFLRAPVIWGTSGLAPRIYLPRFPHLRGRRGPGLEDCAGPWDTPEAPGLGASRATQNRHQGSVASLLPLSSALED